MSRTRVGSGRGARDDRRAPRTRARGVAVRAGLAARRAAGRAAPAATSSHARWASRKDPRLGELLAELRAAVFAGRGQRPRRGDRARRAGAGQRCERLDSRRAWALRPTASSARSSPASCPATIVDADERTIAFMDINPATPGHALVIPRDHSRRPDRDLRRGPRGHEARRAAARRAHGRDARADGFNILNCCGRAAWQTVFHFHVHVIPRYEDDPLKLPWIPRGAATRTQIAAVARGSEASADGFRHLTRDGDVAVITLSNPPLNLFGPDSFDALDECVAEVEARRPRARSGAPRATSSPAASTSRCSPTPSRAASEALPSLVGPVKRLEALEIPTLALPRAVPHGRAGGRPRLRHDLGRGVGAVRPGRARRRPDARRRAAPSGSPSARARRVRVSS